MMVTLRKTLIIIQLIPQNITLLEKLMCSYSRNSLPFVDSGCSLPCSEEAPGYPCHELDESNQYFPALFLENRC
jgi:hypothetical protein